MNTYRWLLPTLRFLRRCAESAGFLLVLFVLVPLLALRATFVSWNPAPMRALVSRWRLFLCHGLDDLRRVYWPGIRYERAADIWFYVVMIEIFAVLNATAKPAGNGLGSGRIFVIKLAHFGDALHIFPMLRELRRQRPDAKLDLLVGPWCAALARTYGLQDELLQQTPRLGLFERGGGAGRRSIFQELRWLLALRRRGYDLVISTSTTTLAEVLLMHALKARRWVGTQLKAGLYEPVGEAILVPYDSRQYEADRVMGLLELVGIQPGPSGLFYPLSSEAEVAAEAILKECGIGAGAPFAVICPGAGWPGKQWLADRFAEIGDRIQRELGFAVVLMGSGGEKSLCAEVARHMKEEAAQLAGRTSLDLLAAIIAKASLFVGNDSGPMHVAACFQIPSVLFFGPTIASKWTPRHPKAICIQHEDCSGCISWHYRAKCLHSNRCMKAISVEEAWRAVRSLAKRVESEKGSTS
jgi:ADP-heptose:LPS heptosyltransferase